MNCSPPSTKVDLPARYRPPEADSGEAGGPPGNRTVLVRNRT